MCGEMCGEYAPCERLHRAVDSLDGEALLLVLKRGSLQHTGPYSHLQNLYGSDKAGRSEPLTRVSFNSGYEYGYGYAYIT